MYLQENQQLENSFADDLFFEMTFTTKKEDDDKDFHTFVDIIEHRVVPSGFEFPEHAIEFLTEFKNGETIWLRDMCFIDDLGNYATKYIDYLTHHGIRYA